jgi:hypothetical protein
MLRGLFVLCVVAAAGAACGCITEGTVAPERTEPPRALLALAGQSCAFRAGGWSCLPGGPGAEGRPGDFILQNAFVRFVVAADDHGGLTRIAGNVIDAAVQGGEDRMRLLAPLIGDAASRQPVCDAIRIQDPGGMQTAAVVVAEGHMPDRPAVGVTTTYTLEPGSHALELITTVRNGTGEMLSLLSAGDAVYHGRTLRSVPDAGFMPAGRTSSSAWVAFFGGDLCWGLLVTPPARIEARHRIGWSELRYARLDVAPGASRYYKRRLMADVGGPERVWQAAYPVPDDAKSHLIVRVSDKGSGGPLAGSQVLLAPTESSSPVMLVTDRLGEVALDLPVGQYDAVVWAPGRPAVGRLPLCCAAGCTHVLPVALSPAARVGATTQMLQDGSPVPAAARVASYPVSDVQLPFPPPGPFPLDGWSGVAYADGSGATLLPMAPAADAPGRSLVVASRGPLFRCDGKPVEVDCGQTAELALTVERVVDPGDYVSVDCRQHSRASPDCAVLLAERAAANACEGLDAAVLSDSIWDPVAPVLLPAGGPELIAGLRVQIDGVGAFSAYPLEADAGPAPDLAWLCGAADAWECVDRLREALPRAVIQLDTPLDEHVGHFALCGFDPLRQRTVPPELCVPFDAIELTTDRGLEGLKRTLAFWFALLNAGRRVAVTGSSGARDLTGASRGATRTFLHCPSAGPAPTRAELTAALRALKSAPNAVVSNGPFIEATLNGQPIGSVVATDGTPVRLEVRVQAAPWVKAATANVYRNGDVVESFPLDQTGAVLRGDRLLELEAPRDCWFVVCVSDTRPLPALYCMAPEGPPAFAVTNPFWVDADGDGELRVGRP